jgi:hypothetical protein
MARFERTDAFSLRNACHTIGRPDALHRRHFVLLAFGAKAGARRLLTRSTGSGEPLASGNKLAGGGRDPRKQQSAPGGARSRQPDNNAQFYIQLRKIAVRITMMAITATKLFVSVTNRIGSHCIWKSRVLVLSWLAALNQTDPRNYSTLNGHGDRPINVRQHQIQERAGLGSWLFWHVSAAFF